MELEKLKIKQSKKQTKLTEIRNLIEEKETKEKLPGLKKKYEGKFFKIRNTYGTDCRGWWLYYMVKKVDSINSCETIEFQKDSHGTMSFEVDKRCYFRDNATEINKESYVIALGSFIAEIEVETNINHLKKS